MVVYGILFGGIWLIVVSEGRKEGIVLFNDAHFIYGLASDMWLRTTQIMREKTISQTD